MRKCLCAFQSLSHVHICTVSTHARSHCHHPASPIDPVNKAQGKQKGGRQYFGLKDCAEKVVQEVKGQWKPELTGVLAECAVVHFLRYNQRYQQLKPCFGPWIIW